MRVRRLCERQCIHAAPPTWRAGGAKVQRWTCRKPCAWPCRPPRRARLNRHRRPSRQRFGRHGAGDGLQPGLPRRLRRAGPGRQRRALRLHCQQRPGHRRPLSHVGHPGARAADLGPVAGRAGGGGPAGAAAARLRPTPTPPLSAAPSSCPAPACRPSQTRRGRRCARPTPRRPGASRSLWTPRAGDRPCTRPPTPGHR